MLVFCRRISNKLKQFYEMLILKLARPNDKESLGQLKILRAREENIDFEFELAEKICGDNIKYPYRSRYYLTKFFQDLGFNFTHDGSTRRFWVRDVLLELDVTQLSYLIQQGLFRKKDYKDKKLRTEFTKDIQDEKFFDEAVLDFKDFINGSLVANETIDLLTVLDCKH